MIEDLARFGIVQARKAYARGLGKAERGLLHATLDLYREAHRRDGETDDVADFRLMRADPLFAELYVAATYRPSDAAGYPLGLEAVP